MKLFNKLANNNTIEDGDIENEVMHRILTAKENIELDGNKERALFLLQHGAIPTGCRLRCDSFGMIRLRSLFMVLMVIHKVNVIYILTICKMEGFERSTKDLKSLKGRKICQQNLGTLNNNGKTDILVAKE